MAQTSPKPSISLFLPVYNDEHSITSVVEKSLSTLSEVSSAFEIIVVDDASPDNAGKIADTLAEKYPEVRVIHHERNRGYGGALMTGFKAARYEWVCAVDGDDEYDVRDIRKMIPLLDFYDLIITFRYQRMYSTFRIFISKTYNMVLRFLFRSPYRDISTGLRMVRKSVLQEVELSSRSPFIGAELTLKLMLKGYRIGEVGIQTFPRKFGKGSATSWRNIKATIHDMLRIRRQVFSHDYDRKNY